MLVKVRLRTIKLMMVMAMDCLLMDLPNDVFKHQIMSYLMLRDVVIFDSATMSSRYRHEWLDKLRDVILIGDLDDDIKLDNLQWLYRRGIYMVNIDLRHATDDRSEADGVNGDDAKRIAMIAHQLKHCTGVVLSDRYTVDAVLSWLLLSPSHTQLLTLHIHDVIDDDRLRSFSELCTELQELRISMSHQLTDASIITISTHCTGLQSLEVSRCDQLTDASIISISTHCTRLQSLNFCFCAALMLADASIISISTHC